MLFFFIEHLRASICHFVTYADFMIKQLTSNNVLLSF